MSMTLSCGTPWPHTNSAPDGDQSIRLGARRRTYTSARTAYVCDHRAGEMHTRRIERASPGEAADAARPLSSEAASTRCDGVSDRPTSDLVGCRVGRSRHAE